MADKDSSRKVVVVDDDGQILELLGTVLRERRYEPILMRRADGLVKLVKNEKPGAVILDLALPDRDGRQLLKELKDDWEAKKVPVIILSAYTARLDVKGREQVDAVITKPFDLEYLVHRVEAAVSKPRT